MLLSGPQGPIVGAARHSKGKVNLGFLNLFVPVHALVLFLLIQQFR